MSECPCKPILNIIPKCDPALNIQPECPVTLNVVETQRGAPGKDATINGVNALEIRATDGITGTTEGKIFTISGQELQGDIIAENNRAIEAEEALDNKIDLEADTRADEITRVEGLISDEETRAKGVEQDLASSIDSNHQAISNHVSNKNNPHEVTKAQVGLGNCDNTSDADKPVSTATQTALNTKVDKVSTANKVYGTDAQGNQTTYDKGSFGQVDDVRVGGVSVVTNKIANLGTMAGETASDYPTLDGNNTFTGDNELTGTISVTMEGAEGEDQSGLYMGNTGLSIYSEGEYSGVSVYVSPIDGLTVQNAAYGLDYSDTYFIANGYGVTCSYPLGNSDGEVVNVEYANDHYATTAQGALADTALQPNDNISELTNNLNYQTDTQVANSIAVETGNRESADNNLQSQIDAIVSSSDVFDIVGTYAELQAYDISTVPVNDIIKVLEDSTHAGAATYYRCIETNNVKSWSYIGSEGASYTKAEADNRFVPQTRTVNNKALSSNIALTASDVGALPSSTVIPTVNDSTVTIKKNGSTVSTFTLNQSSNETVNITVPTTTSELTNDSGFITSSSLPTVNNGQLDIQVNGTSVATFTANQSGNTTANIVVGSGLPSQTGNAGKFLSTDGTDASWQYSITDKGMYSAITQYYPGDVVLYYYDNTYRSYLCIQPALNETPYNEASSYWKPFDTPSKIRIQNDWGDKPILPFMMNGSSGSTITGVMITPGTTSTIANFPTINTSTGLLKAPSGIDGYSPDSAFGATAFSNDYSDLDNLPNYGAGLSYSSSSLQLLDQNGNNLGSAVTIKSTPDLDGVTIDTNSDDELEAIGVIDNNGNAIKTWTGTLAQYNAIATKDPNTLYNITDDMSVTQTILETLYPVGSLYIGKMSTCPLASLIPNSTWTLVASDKVLQGSGTYTAGTSVNAGLPNITGTLERVVTCTSGGSGTAVSKGTGAFSGTPSTAVNKTAPGSGNWWNDTRDLSFKASNSNSIYGKSTTVQPPAYVVNIWERTA